MVAITERAAMVGKTVALREKGYACWFFVTDVREVYGSLQYKLSPTAGIGTLWVNADRCDPLP